MDVRRVGAYAPHFAWFLHGFSSFFHRAFVAGEECVVDLSEAQSEGSEQHRARQLS